jgi:hypothetical protein
MKTGRFRDKTRMCQRPVCLDIPPARYGVRQDSQPVGRQRGEGMIQKTEHIPWAKTMERILKYDAHFDGE